MSYQTALTISKVIKDIDAKKIFVTVYSTRICVGYSAD